MNRASVFEWHKRFKEGRQSVRDDLRKSEHQSWLAKGFRLGLLCWGFKRFRRKRPALFKSGQWNFHQDNAPVHNSILVTDYLTKMGITVPIIQTFLPVSFAYSLSSHGVVMRSFMRKRGYDEGHWHAHTRGLPWSLPEVVGTVEQVHCCRRRLPRRGLEFHVCTINKSVHTKKVWKLI